MNQALAQIYGTPGAQTVNQEELEKQAAAEFINLAAQNGIDLNQYNDAQISEMFQQVTKVAAEEAAETGEKEEKDEEKDEEEKKEAARREHQQKLAFANEEVQARHLGEVMAYSYLDTLQKVAQANGLSVQSLVGLADKTAGVPALPAATLRGAPGRTATAIREAARKVGLGAERHGKAIANFAKDNKGAIGAGAAAGAAGAGAGYMAGRKKEGSALDEIAIKHAFALAQQAGGWDLNVVATKLQGLQMLGGLEESTKLAQDFDQQVHIRALEYLEAAGFPVTWAEAS